MFKNGEFHRAARFARVDSYIQEALGFIQQKCPDWELARTRLIDAILIAEANQRTRSSLRRL